MVDKSDKFDIHLPIKILFSINENVTFILVKVLLVKVLLMLVVHSSKFLPVKLLHYKVLTVWKIKLLSIIYPIA